MEAPEKPLVWLKGEVKTPPFSAEARLEAGGLLRRLQRGERLFLPASRPMSNIGAGCHELRITQEFKAMKTAKKKRLESAGWKVGTAEEFLGLSREEAALVDVKLALGEFLRRHRAKRHLSQEALAMRLGSSQSRIAKLEAGMRGVTLDLLFRALFATGVTVGEIAREIQHKTRSAA